MLKVQGELHVRGFRRFCVSFSNPPGLRFDLAGGPTGERFQD